MLGVTVVLRSARIASDGVDGLEDNCRPNKRCRGGSGHHCGVCVYFVGSGCDCRHHHYHYHYHYHYHRRRRCLIRCLCVMLSAAVVSAAALYISRGEYLVVEK